MKKNVIREETEVQKLQQRVLELERQLAQAQATIKVVTAFQEKKSPANSAPEVEQQQNVDEENSIVNEERFRRAILVAPYPLMIRRDDGHVVMINTAWTEITGYTLEDIPTIEEWTRKAYGEHGPHWQSVILNQGFSQEGVKKWGEVEITIRSGEKRIWDFSTAPLGVDQKGRRLAMTMAVDITERKQAEENLRAARDEATWLARFPGENPNPVVRVSKEGIVLYCNPPAASWRGWRCAMHTAISSPLLDLIELAVKQGRTIEQDVSVGEKFYSVSVIPILEQGYLNLYGRDITERRQAEKALAESERRQREITRLLELDQARLAAILRNLPVGVWIADQNGRLVGSNEEADRIWGGKVPMLNSIAEYSKYVSWHPGSGELLKPEEYPIAVALRTGEPVEPMELEIRRFDGSEGTVLVSAAPIKDFQGILTGVVGVNVDITERKRAEEERLLAERQYTTLFNAVREGFAYYKAIYDEQGTVVDLLVVEINPAGAQISGVAREDQVGRTSRHIWPVVDENLFAIYDRVNKTGETISFDNESKLTGKIYNVMISKIAEGEFLATFNDITQRKQSEKALEESKNRINDILRSLGGGLLALDCTWSIIFANDKAVEIAGLPADQLIGKTLWELWPGLLGTDLENAYRQAMGARVMKQVQVQGNQSGRWYEVSVYPSSEGITIFYMDKTDQILAEERFNQAFHTSPNALVISRQEDGQIEAVNHTFIKFFGYSMEEVIGKTSIELGMFVNPADRQEAVRRLQRDKAVRDFELDVRLKSGEIRNVSLSVEIMNVGGKSTMLTVIQDITLRKRAEEHMAYQARLLANVNDAIVGSDANFRLTTWNAVAESMYGWKAEEVLGRNGVEVLQTQWPQENANEMRRMIAESGRWRGEATQLRKDGTRIPVEVSSMVLRDEQGQIMGYVSVNRDITERKKAEAHINDLLALNEKILKYSSVGILTYKVSGQCVFANERVASIVGTSRDELLDQNFHLIPSWKQSGLYDLVRQAISTQAPTAADIHHVSTFGKDIWITAHCITFQSKGEDHILLSLLDITDRKQAEWALKESEQRLNRAQEIAHLGSWELDLVTNRLTWSDEVYRIFGLQPQEFGATYEAFLEAVHPEDRAAVDDAYSSSIREGRDTYEIEHRVVRRSTGEIRIVHEKCEHFRDQNGRIVRSIGMVADITERKQAEEALQESERRFRSLANSMPQLVWTALPNGKVDYYNQRYEEYREIKQIEARAWDWAPVLHADDLQPTVDAWQHALQTGKIYQIEHRVRMVDGSYRWHLSRGVPVFDENGQIARWFGTATDIHDLKLAEEKLKEYAERLERSNRELEQFAFMASHDLQEPLRKIEMFGDLLLERATSLEDRERNYVDRMRNAAGRMRDMVTGLLQLSRVTTQGRPFVSVDFSQITSDVLSDMEEEIRRIGGKVSSSTLPVVEGDPVQLRQLMQNLISNALKYRQPGAPPDVKIFAKQGSRRVQIFVEDQGIGFEQEDAERIFQPFQRLVGRSQYEGSGIGLAICRRIVERHKGKITALSTPGQGTTFIVTLPVTQPESAKSELRKDVNHETKGTSLGG